MNSSLSKNLPGGKQRPHTGNMFQAFLEKRGIRKKVLAHTIGRNTTCIYEYQKKESMQSSLLWELSIALNHNFFKDIAAQLPDSFSTNVPPDTSIDVLLAAKDGLLTAKDEQIAALQKENERLTMERDILKEVLKISK
jgi:hypothetical protein